jgi:colanic acid biosynthesis glycosyl transferase WcaI
MKILFYGINFAPELIGVGKYSSETVEYLVSQGHDVRVVAAPPYYPQWRVDPAYRAARYRRETIHGAQVWRVPLWVPRRPTGLMRLIHLMSFAASSIPVLLMQWRWKPDLVFQVAPTLFCSFGALALGHVTGARTWLHIQDFESQCA